MCVPESRIKVILVDFTAPTTRLPITQVADRVGYRSLGWRSSGSSPIALALGEERFNALRNRGRQSRLHLVLYESAEIRRARVT